MSKFEHDDRPIPEQIAFWQKRIDNARERRVKLVGLNAPQKILENEDNMIAEWEQQIVDLRKRLT